VTLSSLKEPTILDKQELFTAGSSWAGRTKPQITPTICLAMIVRDEARVIERCLRSVQSLIDYWVICDTGSHDDTPELTRKILAGIPGELHRRPWRDFGRNRTELMRLARGRADYLLLIDADMTVSVDGPLGDLTSDAYLLRCGGEFEYWIPRLVRGDREWSFVGATHEYLDSAAAYSTQKLPALSCVHYADGGSRADKLSRDEALLSAQLAERPGDERAVFYLAQTHRDAGNRQQAVALYRRRAEMAGFDEERFYAAYQAAVLTAEDDQVAALPLLYAAWQLRPSRAEPLLEIAHIARDQGWHELALAVTTAGMRLPPCDDHLFVHRWVYDWGLLFEYGIACYWTGDYESGLRANDDVLRIPDLPRHVAEQALRNREWCAEKLRAAGRAVPPPASGQWFPPPRPQLLDDLVPRARYAQVRLSVESDWPQFNPSIAANPEGGFSLVVRSANYELLDSGNYLILTDDDVIRTVNYLARLDDDLQVRDVRAISEDAIPAQPDALVRGAEDCRLFWWAGQQWLTATRRDQRPDGACQMTLARVERGRAESLEPLELVQQDRHEKNWMPFVVGDELHFVYSCHPFTVLRWRPDTGSLAEVARTPTPPVMAGLRGGSQGVPVGESHLFVVHEAHDDDGMRSYSHRFLLMDRRLQPAGISPRFSYTDSGIEFCAGAARSGDDLVMSFGIGDRVAALALVPLDEVLTIIDPIRDERT
jgi:tetratricopeptide (TPR) repeat protein